MTSVPESKMPRHEEHQYLDLIRDILENGNLERGRNGDTLSVFGRTMRFSLKDGQIPILTTKRVAWKTCAKELFWFLSGSTDNTVLQDQGVHIWDGNSTREYLDSRGLTDYAENELGPIYGYQWRHFGAPYRKRGKNAEPPLEPSPLEPSPLEPSSFDSSSYKYTSVWSFVSEITQCISQFLFPGIFSRKKTEQGIDQIQQIIDILNDPTQRTSRRIILTAWNPAQLDEMALPPCHMFAQFNVRNGTHLSCAMYQRSGDVGLGVPFNIASYSLLTHILATHTGLIADEFVYFLGNAHIYEEHIEALRPQVHRIPFPFPRISIRPQDTIEEYTVDNIRFETSYQYHTSIQMNMVA